MWRPRSRLPASAVRSDGSFTLAPPLLQTLAGGALADGAHVLHLEATDKPGDLSRLDLSFIRDTTAATMSGALAHDTGASGSDRLTNDPKVAGTVTDANGIAKFSGALDRGASRGLEVFQGSTDPNAQVTLVGKGLIADPAGAFRFDNVRLLALGDNNFTAQATDAAGNQSSYALTIALDKSHAAVADANGDGKQDGGDTTNTGNVTLSTLSVTDDNGTPDIHTDDFTLSINGSLAPGASTTVMSAPRVLTQGDFDTSSVTNIATDQGTGGGQTVTATATDTVTLQQNPQINVPIVTTGTPPQFNFPHSVDQIQPKVGGGSSFTFNPGGYIYWDLYSSDVSMAQIKLDSGTTEYTGLAVSIVQVWGSNGIGANTGQGIYRVYVTDNTANTSVPLDNSHLIVSYSIVNGSGQPALSTDKGSIDLVNADPMIGNFNRFKNIQNALTNASNGFTINPGGATGTAGVDKDWTSTATT